MEIGFRSVFGCLTEAGPAERITPVIVERRGRREDAELELLFRRICDTSEAHARPVPLELVMVPKTANSTGLQLADLIARPIGLHHLRPGQPNRAFEIIRSKLSRSPAGEVDGCGLFRITEKCKGPPDISRSPAPTGYLQSSLRATCHRPALTSIRIPDIRIPDKLARLNRTCHAPEHQTHSHRSHPVHGHSGHPVAAAAFRRLQGSQVLFLSLGLLYAAGFFLRPCKNLMFQPSADSLEVATRDPATGSFSGKLRDTRTHRDVEELTRENSQLLQYVDHGDALVRANPLPAISHPLAQGMVVAAVMTNPFSQVHLPREAWMALDVILIAMLGWALHILKNENAGIRPHASLTGTIGQPPKVEFLPVSGVFRRAWRLWPAVVGGAFAIGLLGAKIGDGDFEDFSLWHAITRTFSASFIAALGAWLAYCFMDVVCRSDPMNKGETEQAPSEMFVTVFVLIYLCMAFSGYFSPVPQDEGREVEYLEPWE